MNEDTVDGELVDEQVEVDSDVNLDDGNVDDGVMMFLSCL